MEKPQTGEKEINYNLKKKKKYILGRLKFIFYNLLLQVWLSLHHFCILSLGFAGMKNRSSLLCFAGSNECSYTVSLPRGTVYTVARQF